MLYLLLAILCSTCLLLVFKYTQKHGIETLPVLIVNYAVCGIIGTWISEEPVSFSRLAEKEWLLPTLMLSGLFITVFYMVAASTQTNGVAITAVAFKLSVVIPIVAAYFLYGDSFSILKLAGIALALAAIFLTSKDDGEKTSAQGFAALLPVFVFFGSGISDTYFNYIQATYLSQSDQSFFLVTLFLTAGCGGVAALIVKCIRTKSLPQPNSIVAGIALGIPNYGSAYFILLALEDSGIESSALWTLNNIGIIIISTAAAALLFNERINRYGKAGILLALISIILVSAGAM